MMLIQLKHINFKPVTVNVEGEQKKLLVVEVQSKGEKSTGEKEFVYVGTERLKEAHQQRRFALKHDPEAYVFGTRTNGDRRTSVACGESYPNSPA